MFATSVFDGNYEHYYREWGIVNMAPAASSVFSSWHEAERNSQFPFIVIMIGEWILSCGSADALPRCFWQYARRRFRRDLVPEYLGRCCRSFFERDGFCFAVSLDCENDVATFTVMFQNRYTGPAVARIALRPLGSTLGMVSPTIHCGAAGFGVAKFPVPIPARHQGKTVTFQLGVDVEYPLGKGREVRFRTGQLVRHNSQFGLLPAIGIGLPHFPTGHISNHAAATSRLRLPKLVAEYIPDDATAGPVEELWSLPRNDRRAGIAPRDA